MKKIFSIFFISFFLLTNLFVLITRVPTLAATVETEDTLIKRLNIEQFWKLGLKGEGVNIAVLDTGVDFNHEDLNIEKHLNCIKETDCIEDDYIPDYNNVNADHGTAAIGIINAQHNNKGIKGIAPDSKIFSFATNLIDPNSNLRNIVKAFNWIYDYNQNESTKDRIHIISLSVSFDVETVDKDQDSVQALEEIVTKLYEEQNVLIFSSAGNIGDPDHPEYITTKFPTTLDNIITVGGINHEPTEEDIAEGYTENKRKKDASTGPKVELTAPAKHVDTTTITQLGDGGYAIDGFGGTSSATPIVAGVAALYKQTYPNATNVELRKMLDKNAKYIDGYDGDTDSPERNWEMGYGLVQAPSELPDNYSKTITLASLNETPVYHAPYEEIGDFNTLYLNQGTKLTITKGFHWNDTTKMYDWYYIKYPKEANANIDGAWFKTSDFNPDNQKLLNIDYSNGLMDNLYYQRVNSNFSGHNFYELFNNGNDDYGTNGFLNPNDFAELRFDYPVMVRSAYAKHIGDIINYNYDERLQIEFLDKDEQVIGSPYILTRDDYNGEYFSLPQTYQNVYGYRLKNTGPVAIGLHEFELFGSYTQRVKEIDYVKDAAIGYFYNVLYFYDEPSKTSSSIGKFAEEGRVDITIKKAAGWNRLTSKYNWYKVDIPSWDIYDKWVTGDYPCTRDGKPFPGYNIGILDAQSNQHTYTNVSGVSSPYQSTDNYIDSAYASAMVSGASHEINLKDAATVSKVYIGTGSEAFDDKLKLELEFYDGLGQLMDSYTPTKEDYYNGIFNLPNKLDFVKKVKVTNLSNDGQPLYEIEFH